MELLTPLADDPTRSVPVLEAEAQFSELINPAGKLTVLEIVHVFPPILMAKFAVPLEAGVPVMV
jgi:hypothetical protein